MKCSAVIPIYKEIPTDYEKRSFLQCIRILYKYSIIIICPEHLNVDLYLVHAKEFEVNIKVIRFNDIYFRNISGYNKLLLSSAFYRKFTDFEYILVYQLDSWVFRDELDYWCRKGYDYIGAPWLFTNLYNWFRTGLYPKKLHFLHKILFRGIFMSKVGNGGFSLRKVEAFIKNIELFELAAMKWKANEDSFFAHYVKTLNPFFRIADVKTAIKFSFDTFPDKAYEINNNNLPFGCHAWFRSEPPYKDNLSFWGNIIEQNVIN